MTTHLTPERLAEIRAYCEKATDGLHRGFEDLRLLVAFEGGKPVNILGMNARDEYIFWKEADADFHFHARTDLPAAVEEIMRLRAEVAGLKGDLDVERYDSTCLRKSLEEANEACRQRHSQVGELRQERDTLRQQLAEVKGEAERLNKNLDDLAIETLENNGKMANQIDALRTALQQANAASGDKEIVDWLEKNARVQWPYGSQVLIVIQCDAANSFQTQPNLREAVRAAMEGSRTK